MWAVIGLHHGRIATQMLGYFPGLRPISRVMPLVPVVHGRHFGVNGPGTAVVELRPQQEICTVSALL
jgi:hypothetical protein